MFAFRLLEGVVSLSGPMSLGTDRRARVFDRCGLPSRSRGGSFEVRLRGVLSSRPGRIEYPPELTM